MNWPILLRACFWTGIPSGVPIAASNVIPRSKRWYSVAYLSPDISAHSAKVLDTPLNSITRLVQALRACSIAVDHLTFPGAYPFLPLILSRVWERDGRGGMYDSKASYEFTQSSQTVTGLSFLPPYMVQSLKEGSEHLRIMVFQISYRGFRLLNLALPARLQVRHSRHPRLSTLTRTLSMESKCPCLHVPPITSDLAIRPIITLGIGGVSFLSAA